MAAPRLGMCFFNGTAVLKASMHFVRPLGPADQSELDKPEFFPSDHAALFFAIVGGIWL